MESTILTKTQIEQKIKRIAYQIYECNHNQKSIVLAGIADNGFVFAKKLQKVLLQITPLEIVLCEVRIDKKQPLNAVNTSLHTGDYRNKSLVLVDDVLNSGTTLMYAIRHFLAVPLRQFKTAVLVDRNHKKYPVKADFKGISLSTSLQEHVQVNFTKSAEKAYLV
ncbi:MAG: phosphoribosyltransferase domain-containing protein [Flavobacteriaceae bacterium]|nr:phosphoribosyltransferase domain-containing protein [Flavobacteriaceae bacterium]